MPQNSHVVLSEDSGNDEDLGASGAEHAEDDTNRGRSSSVEAVDMPGSSGMVGGMRQGNGYRAGNGADGTRSPNGKHCGFQSYAGLNGGSTNGFSGSKPTLSIPSGSSLPPASPSRNGGSLPSQNPISVSSSSSAIDLTDDTNPDYRTQSSSAPPKFSEKQPVLVGSIDTSALVLYPVPLMQKGDNTGALLVQKEVRIDAHGDEWLKVKLKFKRTRQSATFGNEDATINVGIIKYATTVGAINEILLAVLGPIMQKGLARMEGWIKRGDTDKMYVAPLNILIFTLPSNISWIANNLAKSNVYLDHPLPYYDSNFYPDAPPYNNPHNPPPDGFRVAKRYRADALAAGQAMTAGFRQSQQKIVEVQREQVDKVFNSLKGGDELHETQPGPCIKTPLFPHQLKGLTFLQQREAEPAAIKAALAQQLTLDQDGFEMVGANISQTGLSESEQRKLKRANKRKEKLAKLKGINSLWEPIMDEDGKVREWKNLVTEVVQRSKEKPKEARGAILADDMGLGKTLQIVALIGSTRESALRFVREGLPKEESDSEDASDASDLSASHFRSSVFGMPDSMDVNQPSAQGKKRKRGEDLKFGQSKIARLEGKARRERIKFRSRATLLVCPLTTLSNWEDQMKDHWNGQVEIVNGFKRAGEKDVRIDKPDLRVYVYHGPQRVQEPEYLNDFDVVITTFTTLQTEYSRQVKSAEGARAYASGANSSSGERDEDADAPSAVEEEEDVEDRDEDGNPFVRGAEKPEVAEERIMLNKTNKGKRTDSDLLGRPSPREAVSPLQAVEWFRIVLDEAHFIKDATTIAAKAACYLEAERRICLTGTPIQNKIEDVWALFKFLRLSPWDEKEVWQTYIGSLVKSGKSAGVVRIQTILKHCTLRRTKESTNNEGKKILSLPPKTESRVVLQFNPEELKIYNSYASKAKIMFAGAMEEGAPKVSMVNMLQELLRLRQVCDHWELVDSEGMDDVEEDLLELGEVDLEEAQQIIADKGVNLRRAFAVVSALASNDALRCQQCSCDFELPRITKDDGDEDAAPVPKGKGKKPKGPAYPVLTKCCHLYCSGCFKEHVYPQWPKIAKGIGRHCALCHASLSLGRDVIEVSPGSCTASEAAEGPRSRAAKRRLGNETTKLSTKMQALLSDLMAYSAQNPSSKTYDPETAPDVAQLDAQGKAFVTKSVVFSQWTSMLDKIEVMLDKASIRYSRLDGTMKRDARAEAMEQLKNDQGCEVILVSLRAGGVGLNLTAATRCYLMDPYWNPAVENQAVDRIHRLGQTRPVTTIKYIISGSVEEKMLIVQKRKQDVAELSLDQGLSKKQLHDRKMEDIRTLFGG